MKVIEIHKKDSTHAADSLILPAGDSPRQISLADGAALLEARTLPGLCTQRFDADIITEGLNYLNLLTGSCLHIGDVELEISAAGKRCFDECVIHQAGNICPIPNNCAFARVLSEGIIKAGMAIRKQS